MDYFAPKESLDLAISRGVFMISQEITYNFVEELCQSILSSIDDETEEIALLISSPGGSVDGATCFSDFAALFDKVKLHGIAMGECGSAAFAILQCCHKRTSLRNCIFFVHYLHAGVHLVFDGTQKDQALGAAQDGTQTQQLMEDLICRRSGMKRSEWRRLIKEGENCSRRRTAKEMLGYGLLDEVIDEYPLF